MRLADPALDRYFELPEEPRRPLWPRCLSFMSVLGLQALGLLVIISVALRPELAKPLQALTVRMLEIHPAKAAPPRVEPPKAKPPVVPRLAPLSPPPILSVASTASTPSSFFVAPQPEPRPVESIQPPPAPLPVVAARFDADYLQNPKPVYPPISRRLGEQGKVVLRVRVSALGQSMQVDIKQSSGHPRLDEAALSAVEKWRFVPARQGSEAVEAVVLVPLHFTLDS